MSEITDKMVISMAKALGHEGVYANGKTIRRALTAALQAAEAKPVAVTTNCYNCGRIIDKREISEGGDGHGCELTNGDWICSPACWNEVVDGSALAPTPSHSLEEARGDITDRLRVAVITEVNPIDDQTYQTELGMEAAGEIERLRAALREAKFAVFSSDMTIKDRADQAIRLALK